MVFKIDVKNDFSKKQTKLFNLFFSSFMKQSYIKKNEQLIIL